MLSSVKADDPDTETYFVCAFDEKFCVIVVTQGRQIFAFELVGSVSLKHHRIQIVECQPGQERCGLFWIWDPVHFLHDSSSQLMTNSNPCHS